MTMPTPRSFIRARGGGRRSAFGTAHISCVKRVGAPLFKSKACTVRDGVRSTGGQNVSDTVRCFEAKRSQAETVLGDVVGDFGEQPSRLQANELPCKLAGQLHRQVRP